MTKPMTGRDVIKFGVAEINSRNIIEEVNKTVDIHMRNLWNIDYLYKHYRGDQPI